MLTSSLRLLSRFAKRTPGLRGLRELAVNSGPGGGFFAPAKTAWLLEPTLHDQLPLPFRALGRFCQAQGRLWSVPAIGGDTAFRLAGWLSPLCGGQDPLVLEIAGVTAFLDPRDPRMLMVPNELLQRSPTRHLARLLSPGDTFLDVGANHGAYSLVASRLVGEGGKIVAIEAIPKLAELVRQSLGRSAHCPFSVHGVACGATEGQTILYVPTGSSGQAGVLSKYSGVRSHGRVVVPLRRFDQVVEGQELPGNAVLKLDVEGSESAFLMGASSFLRRVRPTIILEINQTALAAAGSSPDALIAQLRALGYERWAPLSRPTDVHDLRSVSACRGDLVILGRHHEGLFPPPSS